MATLQAATVSTEAPLADDADISDIHSLKEQYHLRELSLTVRDGLVRIAGYSSFNIYGTGTAQDEVQTESFVEDLQSLLAPDAELLIQSVGNTKLRHPVYAVQYRITRDRIVRDSLGQQPTELQEE
jgi:hypothetical protein